MEKTDKSFRLIFIKFTSVNAIAIKNAKTAIENLKNKSVVASMLFWVNVRTNIPVDANITPAIMGRSK